MLFIWVGHLLLAPFDLASISTGKFIDNSAIQVTTNARVELPVNLPSIASRVLPIALQYLGSPTREQDAAAALLVRLCARPDMRLLGLIQCLVQWAVESVLDFATAPKDIHHALGVLSFLSRLVASGSAEGIREFIPRIYITLRHLHGDQAMVSVQSSAVAKKHLIKSFRNIVIHILDSEHLRETMDASTVLEETIDFLLTSLADRDTPVRFAASKALSVITDETRPFYGRGSCAGHPFLPG